MTVITLRLNMFEEKINNIMDLLFDKIIVKKMKDKAYLFSVLLKIYFKKIINQQNLWCQICISNAFYLDMTIKQDIIQV